MKARARLTWLDDATNGFFARRGIFEELCVKDESGQTCLTRSEVDELLDMRSAAAGTPQIGESAGPAALPAAIGDESTGEAEAEPNNPADEANAVEEPTASEPQAANTPADQLPATGTDWNARSAPR